MLPRSVMCFRSASLLETYHDIVFVSPEGSNVIMNIISVWISNCIHYKVLGEIIYPIPNFTNDVWEWVSNFIPHCIVRVITYPCWDLNGSMSVNGAPGAMHKYSYYVRGSIKL